MVASFGLLELCRHSHIVLVGEVGVCCFFGLRVLHPLLALLENLLLFQVEMAVDNIFEALRRVLDLVDHRVLDVADPYYVGVSLVLSLTFHFSLLILVPRFIEIDIFVHDDALGGDEELEKGGQLGVPVLSGLPLPGSKQGQADLAVVVEVGVESDLASSSGCDDHFRGLVGVSVLAEHIEQECSVAVRSVLAAHD